MIDAVVLRCLLGPSAFMTLATRRPVPAPERAGLLALLALVLGTLSSSTTFGASLRPSRHCDCFCENGSTRFSPPLPELDCSRVPAPPSAYRTGSRPPPTTSGLVGERRARLHRWLLSFQLEETSGVAGEAGYGFFCA